MKSSKGEKTAPMKEVVDLRSRSVDPRVDPQATTRISKEELDAVLRRSSGTRPATGATTKAVRRQSGAVEIPSTRPVADPRAESAPDHEAMFGPRDDHAPMMAPGGAPPAEISHARFVMPAAAAAEPTSRSRRAQIALLFVAVIALASLVGFLAGRLGR